MTERAERLFRDGFKGIEDAYPLGSDALKLRDLIRNSERALELAYTEDTGEIAFIILDDERDSIGIIALHPQVLREIMIGFDIVFEARRLRVDDEDDAVDVLQDHAAR